MPLPRTATVPDTTITGSWRPTWSPGRAGPGLPPLTVVHDPHDDYAFMAAALTSHTPALGRVTVHPTAVASAPASLAHDLLRSMGKHLPPAGSEDGTYWTGNTETAWRAVAAWVFSLRIGHVIVTRAHRISSRHFEYLFALRELTGIRLTLLCNGPLPPVLAAALAVLPHEAVHGLAAHRRAVVLPRQLRCCPSAVSRGGRRTGSSRLMRESRASCCRCDVHPAAVKSRRRPAAWAARCSRCLPPAASRPSPMSTPRSSRTGFTRVSPIPSTPRRWRCASSPAARTGSCSCPPRTRLRRPGRTVTGNIGHRPGQRT